MKAGALNPVGLLFDTSGTLSDLLKLVGWLNVNELIIIRTTKFRTMSVKHPYIPKKPH